MACVSLLRVGLPGSLSSDVVSLTTVRASCSVVLFRRRSGEHIHAIRCIKQLEVDGSQAVDGGEAKAPSFLFAKCKARDGKRRTSG